ncbi:hypothetical protein YC2023_076636 [Brassica napus]|uniref:Phospholipase/carboxylesterase/thioesterase domain-containing protein n=1 Tax=Brassica oleracea var. oleracea TaxID=109376 RepID=A0A0D3CRC3_BRAOL
MAASSSSSNSIGTEDGYVLEPQGEHRVTIVWLHDVHENSYISLQIVRSLNLRNIKWICLDSGTHVDVFSPGGGVPRNSWCNVGMITDTTQDCRDELDSAAVRVANILSTEPENVIKGVGGVGQGAQVALNFAKWNAVGDHTMNMRLVIGINSWRIPTNRIDYAFGAAIRASWQSILLIRGNLEPSIPLYFAKETAVSLIDDGFGEVSFVQFRMLGPEITVSVLKKVEVWLSGKLPLDPN